MLDENLRGFIIRPVPIYLSVVLSNIVSLHVSLSRSSGVDCNKLAWQKSSAVNGNESVVASDFPNQLHQAINLNSISESTETWVFSLSSTPPSSF